MNFRIVLHFLGLLLIGLAAMMALMAMAAYGFGEYEQTIRFSASGLVTGFVAGALMLGLRGDHDGMNGRREMFMMLALGWLIVPLFAGLPFLNASLGLSVFEAWFEGVSALTTTGISLIDFQTRNVPDSIYLWRGFLGWVGGFCAVIMMIVFLAGSGLGGLDSSHVSFAHGEGEGVMSRSRQTIRLLGPIYAAITIIGWAVLSLSGLPGLDSLLLAMGGISTSGMAGPQGLAPVGGNLLAMFAIALMCLAGTVNMTHHARLFLSRRRTLTGIYFGEPELSAIFAWIFGGTLICTAGFIVFQQAGIWEALTTALFNMVSFASTTGYGLTIVGTGTGVGTGVGTGAGLGAESSVAGLPLVGAVTLGIAMVIGGAVGSTASGIRPIRLMILYMQGERELARMVHVKSIVRFRIRGQHLQNSVVRAVSALLLLYILCGVACGLGLAAAGMPVEDAMIAALSAMTNCGPALAFFTNGAVTGPDLEDGMQAVYAAGMILGRVEVLAFIALLTPQYWRR